MGDWFDAGGDGSQVAVAELVTPTAVEYLVDCVQQGAMVSLGGTRDGGALGVTVTVDGRWRREWFRDSEALESWLKSAVAAVEVEMAARKTAPPGSSARTRRVRGL